MQRLIKKFNFHTLCFSDGSMTKPTLDTALFHTTVCCLSCFCLSPILGCALKGLLSGKMKEKKNKHQDTSKAPWSMPFNTKKNAGNYTSWNLNSLFTNEWPNTEGPPPQDRAQQFKYVY